MLINAQWLQFEFSIFRHYFSTHLDCFGWQKPHILSKKPVLDVQKFNPGENMKNDQIFNDYLNNYTLY